MVQFKLITNLWKRSGLLLRPTPCTSETYFSFKCWKNNVCNSSSLNFWIVHSKICFSHSNHHTLSVEINLIQMILWPIVNICSNENISENHFPFYNSNVVKNAKKPLVNLKRHVTPKETSWSCISIDLVSCWLELWNSWTIKSCIYLQ